MKKLLYVLLLLLNGCGVYTSQMTPEQIAEMVKDKNLNLFCLVANTPYGKGTTTVLNLDRAILPPNSTVKVDDACKLEVLTGPPK